MGVKYTVLNNGHFVSSKGVLPGFPSPGFAKAANSPVNLVPISHPITIGYALSRDTIPRPQIGVKIAKTIELDCTAIVIPIPART